MSDDHIRCPGCSYDLSGLPCLICPECGAQWTHDDIDKARSIRFPTGSVAAVALTGGLLGLLHRAALPSTSPIEGIIWISDWITTPDAFFGLQYYLPWLAPVFFLLASRTLSRATSEHRALVRNLSIILLVLNSVVFIGMWA